MKNFISGRVRRRSLFSRMLMGMGALATTYIIMPRAKKMVNTAVKKGLEGSDSLVQKGKETVSNMMGGKITEKKSPDDPESHEFNPGIYDEESETQKQIIELQLAVSRLESQLNQIKDD